jgi:hypothetical protein
MAIGIAGRFLRALLHIAPEVETRYYLCGVYFDPTGYAVATNGHMLLAVKIDKFDGEGFIVPRDVISARLKAMTLAKSRRYTVIVSPTEIDGEAYKAIDGKFPEWQRVIPRKPSGEHALYDPEYLCLAETCIRDMTLETRDRCFAFMHRNGNGAGVVRSKDLPPYVLMVIMPRREPDPNNVGPKTALTDTYADVAAFFS